MTSAEQLMASEGPRPPPPPSSRDAMRWRILSELGQGLSHVLDGDEMLRELARLVVRELADYCITYLLEDGRIRRVGAAHADPAREDLMRRLADLSPPTLTDAYG